MADKKTVEYVCSQCGVKRIRREGTGRPEPGRCPRKNPLSNGQARPHTWVINRKY